LHSCFVTTRKPVGLFGTISCLSSSPSIQFVLEDRSTWSSLPPPTENISVVITFALGPDLGILSDFYDGYLSKVKQIVVYSTTGIYGNAIPAATVDETCPLTGEGRAGISPNPRVPGELFLQERGATVLPLSGLYGYDRQPINWLRRGMIKNGTKLVNLVHCDDVIRITRAVLALPLRSDPEHNCARCRGLAPEADQESRRYGNDGALRIEQVAGQRINVSGQTYRWQELAKFYADRSESNDDGASFYPLPEDGEDGSSRYISNSKLVALLPPGYTFIDARDDFLSATQ
jgi:hypothetical protein